MLFKLRKLTSNNKTGDSYGITIPKHIAIRQLNTLFYIHASGSLIILESGCKTEESQYG